MMYKLAGFALTDVKYLYCSDFLVVRKPWFYTFEIFIYRTYITHYINTAEGSNICKKQNIGNKS